MKVQMKGLTMYQKSKTIENVLVMLVDLVCLLTSVLLAFLIRYKLFMGINQRGDQIWQLPLMVMISVSLEVFFEIGRASCRERV